MIHYEVIQKIGFLFLYCIVFFCLCFGQMDEENGNEITVGDLPTGNLNISQVKIFISKPLMHDVLVLNVSYLDIV